MAETIVLNAAKRAVTGKEVRHLRREGQIPGVLYGPGIEPVSVQVPWLELRPVHSRRRYPLIQVSVEASSTTR